MRKLEDHVGVLQLLDANAQRIEIGRRDTICRGDPDPAMHPPDAIPA